MKVKSSILKIFFSIMVLTGVWGTYSNFSAHAQTTIQQNNRAIVLEWSQKHNVSDEFAVQNSLSLISPNYIPGSRQAYYPRTNIPCKPGDILITNQTSSSGLTGHSAIVLDIQGDVAEIKGLGYHPQFTSQSDFWSTNKYKVMVKRYPNATDRQNAANWATNWVNNHPSEKYKIYSIWITNPSYGTYCSKIVWDAFYFGNNHKVILNYSMGSSYYYDICAPYDLSGDSSMTTMVNFMK
ncbi:hypothetical protein [Sporolactobacillus pectinivorans]|uniref:hypothetical protein n=1 Tax=Sporolactobacillus pectinivorans TaxID=1591408 RepID=UPI000C26652F|nr:hypothetical protein [Sporolactobacillus pectinivorans]